MKRAGRPVGIPASKLRWRCSPAALGFRSTRELRPRPGIIGQERALAALDLGLRVPGPGYNVFVVGAAGTGKSSAIQHVLRQLQRSGDVPPDLCFVHDFERPEAPRALRLPPGRGRQLRADMHRFVDELRSAVTDAADSEALHDRRRRVMDEFKTTGRSLFSELESRVEAEQFQIVQVHMGDLMQPELHAVVAGEPLTLDKLRELAADGRFDRAELERLQARYDVLQPEMQRAMAKVRGIERKLRTALRELERSSARELVAAPLAELRERYADVAGTAKYFTDLEAHIVDSLHLGLSGHASGGPGPDGPPVELDWTKCEINLAVDNAETQGPPVIVEMSPTYRNLFGSIDYYPDRTGVWRADFTRISAGSLLAANGGYLVVNLLDTVSEPAVWPTLKRWLRNRKAEIRTYDMFAGLTGASIKPQAVDLDVGVVVVGDSYTYHLLHAYDDDFHKIFKVKAEFDTSIARSARSMRQYAHFVARLCGDENLLPFDAGAVAALIEYGAREAGRQTRLSTRFGELADVVRESDHWAREAKASNVHEAHVERALDQRRWRVDLLEERLQRSIDAGSILLDVRGKRNGQVNALTIFDLGDHAFGRPSRITCEVSMGRSGIINIEREANLSGSTHDKGVLILAGYLRGKYAQHRPLTLSASLAFEQTYGGIEGDSASIAELFALISAIAELPLRQDIGVTGSISQKGDVQPIGGANEKIEGFFDVCRAKGLTGTQGVIIPVQNAGELMLRKDVVAAVRDGRFHIYAIRSIDQGLEIMTGIKAGRRTRYAYEHDTVHGLVDEALNILAEDIKEYVEGSDTVTGRPPAQGLADEEDDDGDELRPLGRRRGARRPTARGSAQPRRERGRRQ